MKSVALWWVLVAGCALLQDTSAGLSVLSLDWLKEFTTAPALLEDPVVAEENTFEKNVSAEVVDKNNAYDLPELPIELDTEAPGTPPAACSINIRSGLTEPQPVFLQTDGAAFYPFSETGYMQLDAGETIQMFCSDHFKPFSQSLIAASCVGGTTFRVNGTSYKFSELVCKSWPTFAVKRTGSACNGGILLSVGFEVSPSRFAEQMQICFNEEEEVTRYVYHKLQPGSNYYQTGVERLNFKTCGFFDGKNVNQLYSQKSQVKTIDEDLGGEGSKYFNFSKNLFLSRGHMCAKADAMYGSQQRATFTFVNVAPQWQTFNAGNWARMEDGVRAWVSKNKIYVECYTGVYGVTTLPNNEGHETPLYLSRDANNNGLIPVPMLYFRVVIQPDTGKGIVFVGVNNPHLTLEQIRKDYIICADVSDQVNYINWKKSSIIAGYSYACEVADFLKTVKTLPTLSADGGLLI